MPGEENLISDPEQLIQIADDPGVKEKINKAFNQAGEEIDAGDANMVVDLIEELAKELAYFETLREQFRGVLQMQEKTWSLRKAAAKHRSFLDTATSVGKLLAIAVEEFGEEFDMADGQTGEIISVLKNIGMQKDYIRSV